MKVLLTTLVLVLVAIPSWSKDIPIPRAKVKKRNVVRIEHSSNTHQRSTNKGTGHFSNNLTQTGHCLSELPSEEKILQIIQEISKTGESPVQGMINGVEFKDESPVLMTAFSQLTTALNTFGSYPAPENQLDIQSKFEINPSCDKVLCAVKKIWGEAMGPKMLYILLKHQFNTSELAFDNSSRLTVEELEDILLALEDIPEHLVNIGRKNQRLNHYTRFHLPPYIDKGTYATALISLLDLWSMEPRNARRYMVYHEVAHDIAIHLSNIDRSTDWVNQSGWINLGDDNWKTDMNTCFVSPYAKRGGPYEDFAETMAVYRYGLKNIYSNFAEKCSGKFQYMKEVIFKGKEYSSPASCQ